MPSRNQVVMILADFYYSFLSPSLCIPAYSVKSARKPGKLRTTLRICRRFLTAMAFSIPGFWTAEVMAETTVVGVVKHTSDFLHVADNSLEEVFGSELLSLTEGEFEVEFKTFTCLIVC